ncbi:MAG: nucleotidyltransferase domain-containing protein [Oscillospiraceae bacterium]|nr:nucleotidyltransferase domain-containing protein [Oscillospiraceae bacterium]
MANTAVNVDILETITNYISEIKKHYKVDSIVLFGSYAHGTNHEDSDIDIAVISSDITDVFDDMAKLMSLTWGINTKIEPHPIKTENFRKDNDPFIDEIIQTGIQIYAAA